MKPSNGGTDTEMPAEDGAWPKQISDENTKPPPAPHATNPHLTSWQPLRTKSNGRNEPTQSISHPNDVVKRGIDSESGTEADDEHFLLGLPASRSKKTPKGLERTTSNTTNSGMSDEHDGLLAPKSGKNGKERQARTIMDAISRKRTIELLRRISEVGLLGGLGCIVYSGDEHEGARLWRTGMRIKPHSSAMN